MLNRVVSDPSLEDEISNLHVALRLLLPPKSDFIKPTAPTYTTPASLAKLAVNIDRETVLQLGARTLDAVELFKLQEGLASPEDDKFTRQRLDRQTADKLNAYLEDMGAFDPPDLKVVYGQVSYAGVGGAPDVPATNIAIEVFDDSGSRNLIVARTTSDAATGQYRMSISFAPTDHRSVGIAASGGAYLARIDLVRGDARLIRADLLLTAPAAGDLPFRVSGIVRRPSGNPPADAPVEGVLVYAYLASQGGRKLASSLPTDAQGGYVLASVAPSAEPLMVGVEEAGVIVARSAVWPNGGGNVTRDLLLAASVQLGWIVKGTVRDAQGGSLPNLVVRAVDRDLRVEQPLGEDSTDALGRYSIGYAAPDFAQAESGGPDLLVRVFRSPASGEPALAESALLRDAPRQAVIDLVAPVQAAGTATEFERYSALLMPLLVGQGEAGADLPPDQLNGSDVLFLARETGLPGAAVQAWAAAARALSEVLQGLDDAGITPVQAVRDHGWPLFYAVMLATLAARLDAVLARGVDDWRGQQLAAETQGLVPVVPVASREAMFTALDQLRQLLAMDVGRNPGSALAQVLALSPLPQAVALLARGIAGAQGLDNADAFLVLADAHPDALSAVYGFVRTVRLHGLTGGEMPLTATLLGSMDDDGHSIEPLVALSTPQWVATLRTAGSAASDDALTTRSLGLQTRLERLHPLPALLGRLGDGGVQFADPQLADLPAVLDTHGPLAEMLLSGIGVGPGETAPLSDKLVTTLQNLGRYTRTGLGMQAGADLINVGIDGPGFTLTYGRDVIIEMLRDKYPLAYIDAYWYDIRQLGKGGKGLFGDIIGGWRTPWFFGGGAAVVPPEVRDNLPTLSGLFGDLDECICRPCESVLGLPAYLVDLLNLLKTVPATGTLQTQGQTVVTAQTVLRARRPDIFTLPLSCDNADTEVQHIDLAIEVLKAAVLAAAGGSSVAQVLGAAPYPWTLPHDRGAAEARAYLQRLGVSPLEVSALRHGATAAEITAITLGIMRPQISGASTASEWDLLVTARSAAPLWAAWGVAAATSQTGVTIADPAAGVNRTGAPAEVLGWASVLCHRAGLTLSELQQVLATRFVGALSLSNLDGCKTSQMQLSSRSEPVYDSIHRFVRLWRKLPAWSIALLDSALVACSPASTAAAAPLIDATVLHALAAAERARVALGLAPEALLGLRMPLADVRLMVGSGAGSLQQKLFGWLPTPIPASATLGAVLDKVAAGLGADSRDVAGLIASGTTTAADRVPDLLSVANLSWLYRHLKLASALGMTPVQLVRLTLLTEMAAFAPTSATFTAQAGFERLLALQSAAQRMAATGFGVELSASALLPAARLQALASGPGLVLKSAEQIENDLASVQTALRQPSQGAAMPARRFVQRTLAQALGQDAADQVLSALSVAADADTTQPLPTTPDAQALATLTAGAPAGTPPPPGPRPLGALLPLFSSAEASSLLATTATANATLDARLASVVQRIDERHREEALITAWQQRLRLAPDSVAGLLDTGLQVDPAPGTTAARRAADLFLAAAFWSGSMPPAVNEAAWPELHDWVHRVDRLAALLQSVDNAPAFSALLTQARWSTGSGQPAAVDWRLLLAPRGVPGAGGAPRWSDWQQVLDLAWLARQQQLTEPVLAQLFAGLSAGSGTGGPTDSELRPLAERLGVAAAEVLALAACVAPTVDRQTLRTPSLLRRLWLLTRQLGPAGATAAQALVLVDTSNNAVAAQTARQLVLARWGASAAAVVAPVDDRLRMQRRDALVAWLLQQRGLLTADALYETYLIDPQVQPCFRTTRVLQAVAAVQLFVQHVLYGMEPNLGAGAELRRRWNWMRSYRVWEANRKVFLFPENWLFPELRDDKSSSFRFLESALGQGELTSDVARQAFGQFLDDVGVARQTQVLGMFEDVAWDTSQPPRRTRRDLYVVGRSANPPYAYFWRKCTDFGRVGMEWTAWQRVELDIEGDHVLPFLLGNQLFIAWPRLQKARESGTAGAGKWKFLLAWSHFDGKRWSPISTSRENGDNADELDLVPFSDERSGFAFRCHVPPDGIEASVHAYAMEQISGTSLVKERTPADSGSPLVPPTGSYDIAATTRLAALIDEGWGVFNVAFAENYRLMLEAHCLVRYVRDNQIVNPFYTHLDVFGDPTAPSRHKHVSTHEPEVARWLASIDLKSKLPEFVNTYLQYAYSRSVGILYRSFVDAIFAQCHSRRVSYRVWVRLSAGGASDLKELNRNNGSFVVMLGSRALTLAPSEAWSELRMGDAPQLNCGLHWTGPNLRAAQLEPLAAVARGQSAVQTLHFEIDGTTATNLSSYGVALELGRKFKRVALFVLNAAGTAQRLPGDSLPLEIPVNGADIWMNGFRESLLAPAAPTTAGLTLRNAASQSVAVFSSSLASRFEMVGATTQGSSYLLPSVWHYLERGASAYIDLQPEAGALRLLPDAGRSADVDRIGWAVNDTLASGTEQIDSGGAEQLPIVAPAFSNAIPQDLLAGRKPFDGRLPHACYNWEVFFHGPLLIADQLSKQQRFEDAERWLRLVFDPTSTEPGNDARRFLRLRVFKELDPANDVTRQLTALARAAGGTATSTEVAELRLLIERWRSLPFRPFLIARRRHLAFLWRTLFAYLDNLLAWADSVYRRDTREAVAEASLLYVLAARILGPRPRLQAQAPARPAQSYDGIAGAWDEFANLWLAAGAGAGTTAQGSGGTAEDEDDAGGDGSLYFCIPVNDKLFTYWNTVESRLFNIRHCRNIEGTSRQLPLTDPPIDPELLVRATAAGLDIGEVVAGLYARQPNYRFTTLVARAAELAGETRALGGALLAALEKRDAEALSLLRSGNEVALLGRVTAVRELQINEAGLNIEALRASRVTAAARYEQYQRLLGRKDATAPIEQASMGDESMLGRAGTGGSNEASSLGLLDQEIKQIEYLGHAYGWSVAAGVVKGVAGVTHMSSSIALAAGVELPSKILTAIGTGLSTTGDMFELVSRGWQHGAGQESLMAGHVRRRDDWAFQSNQTLKELRQIDRQILANEIRLQLARKELDNHLAQADQAAALDEFMRGKYSNEQLYGWMQSQLSAVHWAAYRLALDLARRAEEAGRRELGLRTLSIIRNDHWNSLRSGLLAGERLHQDIKRLDVEYLDLNRREYELTKHISLRRLDPMALLKLKTRGVCEFEVPEWLFDLETPGTYMRRIKAVSLSIPCVVGPYASVNCRLTLLRNEVRQLPEVRSGYPRGNDDDRFIVRYGASESIITSSGRDDSGLFETSMRDERYLPFEGAGAVGRWRLEMANKTPQFDFDTITDVVLHLRYTARDGGDDMRAAAQEAWFPVAPATPSPPRYTTLLSVRTDFATEWARVRTTGGALQVQLSTNLLPYWMTALQLSIRKVSLLSLPVVDASDDSSFNPEERWPQATLPSDVLALGADGTGVASLGVVAPEVDDILLILEVGIV